MLQHLVIGLLLILSPSSLAAQERTCTEREFAATVDETAAALRNLNTDSEKRFQSKLLEVGKQRGWNETERAAQAAAVMSDPRLGEFNSEIEALVLQIDNLSGSSGSAVSCQRLDELRRVRDRLLTVMGQKSGYMLAELGDSGRTAALAPANEPPSATEATPPRAAEPAPRDDSFERRMQDALKRQQDEPRREERAPPPPAASGWAADVAQPAARSADGPLPLAPVPQTSGASTAERRDLAALPPEAQTDGALLSPSAVGYTIEEIRNAGRGVFGTLTSELAAVINYAFQQFGRPNAYVIGDEGSGAFLAGLRYGKGKLHARIGGEDIEPVEIYWQGPSFGFDFGATGSRTLFLVYNLSKPERMFKRYSGVDGTAYVVGGVGLTVLAARDTVVVPIRTGLGLRIGASVGYLKFSERSMWNPF